MTEKAPMVAGPIYVMSTDEDLREARLYDQQDGKHFVVFDLIRLVTSEVSRAATPARSTSGTAGEALQYHLPGGRPGRWGQLAV